MVENLTTYWICYWFLEFLILFLQTFQNNGQHKSCEFLYFLKSFSKVFDSGSFLERFKTIFWNGATFLWFYPLFLYATSWSEERYQKYKLYNTYRFPAFDLFLERSVDQGQQTETDREQQLLLFFSILCTRLTAD